MELKPTDAISIANSSKFGVKKPVVKASQFPYPHNCFKAEELSQSQYPSVECITVAIGPPNFIKHAYEKIVKNSSSATFGCDSMVYTTRYLWRQVKWYYYRQVVAYWILLCMFSLGHIYTGPRYVCFGVNALLVVLLLAARRPRTTAPPRASRRLSNCRSQRCPGGRDTRHRRSRCTHRGRSRLMWRSARHNMARSRRVPSGPE